MNTSILSSALLVAVLVSSLAGCIYPTDSGAPPTGATALFWLSTTADEPLLKENESLLWVRGRSWEPLKDSSSADGRLDAWAYGILDPSTGHLVERSQHVDTGLREVVLSQTSPMAPLWPPVDPDYIIDSSKLHELVEQAHNSTAFSSSAKVSYWLSSTPDGAQWTAVVRDEASFDYGQGFTFDASSGLLLPPAQDLSAQQALHIARARLDPIMGNSSWIVEMKASESTVGAYEPWGHGRLFRYAPIVPDISWGDGKASAWTLKFFDPVGNRLQYVVVTRDGNSVSTLAVPEAPEFMAGSHFYPHGGAGNVSFSFNAQEAELYSDDGFTYRLDWGEDGYYWAIENNIVNDVVAKIAIGR